MADKPSHLESPKDIPANPNTLLNGWIDPTPEKGESGKTWRTIISGLKGIFGK